VHGEVGGVEDGRVERERAAGRAEREREAGVAVVAAADKVEEEDITREQHSTVEDWHSTTEDDRHSSEEDPHPTAGNSHLHPAAAPHATACVDCEMRRIRVASTVGGSCTERRPSQPPRSTSERTLGKEERALELYGRRMSSEEREYASR
jgi:hypothetical protein